ncbi:MAG TPA: hypothetical protein PLC89_28995 [Haliscomenobacter sp.]|uniref:hypothetical protein n=1 Tax=Haliscomenobacter sp. TaxID=2717303 RepID=UPI002C54ABAD|nr:hypothetical protein [Haliscomenobacter sp.]HOY21386.1 hypothetical protein [Haliscomenobacter sp.]
MGIVLTFILLAAALEVSECLEWDESGIPKLTEKRQKKLEKAVRELEKAEQYALLVEIPGYYPCYSCKDTSHIFLNISELWRYGSTVKKEEGRYRKTLKRKGLAYRTQFVGNIFECKKQELIKIYNYPTLPENLRRKVPLIRPPGNKIDQ